MEEINDILEDFAVVHDGDHEDWRIPASLWEEAKGLIILKRKKVFG